jgi:hypothetical protein
MDLFERVKLLVRSTLSGGLPEFSSSGGDPQKMLDKAESKLEILRDDLARAEKKGNDELAGKLKTEIADLEKLIAKARGKAQGKAAPAHQPAATAPAAQPAQAEAVKMIEKPAPETPQETAKPADVVIDESRVADQLKKLREGK